MEGISGRSLPSEIESDNRVGRKTPENKGYEIRKQKKAGERGSDLFSLFSREIDPNR